MAHETQETARNASVAADETSARRPLERARLGRSNARTLPPQKICERISPGGTGFQPVKSGSLPEFARTQIVQAANRVVRAQR
jgi:hypothetical protein